MNVLFVCSRNRWRSRTAETIFRNHPIHQVRSAGTEREARVKVSEKLIQWSDLIFVMEKRHRERLQQKFESLMESKTVIILEIEDNYEFMDPELVGMLESAFKFHLEKLR